MLTNLRLGPLSLPTYPLLLLLGLYVGLWFGARVAARRGLDPNHVYNIGFYAFLAALVAGRLGHVVHFFSAYVNEPLSILSPNLAAFEPLAAAAGAALVIVSQIRKHHLPVAAFLDALASAALMTLAFVAFADALNGRHYGAPSVLPWALTQWSVRRHPVQIYELLGILAVLALIWFWLDRLRPGFAALAAVAGYAAVHLVVDAFRDQTPVIGDGFRLNQVIALVVLLLALLVMYQINQRPAASD